MSGLGFDNHKSLWAILAICLFVLSPSVASATDTADLEAVRSAAEQGDASALDRLANAYWRGRGVPQDIGQAETYFRQAITAGRDRSRINLARLLSESGRGEEALAVFDEAQALGLTDVDYWIAVGHVRGGFGSLSTPEAALSELESLASGGDDRAAYALADALDGGAAVEPDPERAVEIYQGLVDAGNENAMARLGTLAWRGLGMPKDLDLAASLLRRAIDAGDPRAVINLSRVMIEAGMPDEARDLLSSAANEGLEGADFWLARFNARGDFGRQSDRAEGRAELERLSAAGDIGATADLARLAAQNRRWGIDAVVIAERLETASAAGSDRATAALLRLLRECARHFPEGVARRRAILAERGDQLGPETRLGEEIWLITAENRGRARYQAVSERLSDETGAVFQRGVRTALSADRRAYTWVLQERLAEQGYYRGRINGWMTTPTIFAFRRFCRANDVDHICTHGPLRGEAASTVAPFL